MSSMKPLVFYNIEQFTENGKDYVSLEKEEFQRIINETYNAGYEDGKASCRDNVIVTNDKIATNNKLLNGTGKWYDPFYYNTCKTNHNGVYSDMAYACDTNKGMVDHE